MVVVPSAALWEPSESTDLEFALAAAIPGVFWAAVQLDAGDVHIVIVYRMGSCGAAPSIWPRGFPTAGAQWCARCAGRHGIDAPDPLPAPRLSASSMQAIVFDDRGGTFSLEAGDLAHTETFLPSAMNEIAPGVAGAAAVTGLSVSHQRLCCASDFRSLSA